MTRRVVISLDAMGGVNAPNAVITAAAKAAIQYPNLDFIICGDKETVSSLLSVSGLPEDRYIFQATQTIILDDDKPVYALRYGQDSSMRKAIDAIKDGRADACVSCGNTGALMVTAKMVLGTLPGIRRPAIAGIFPTISGSAVMLDMGANSECNDVMLFQFGLIGRCFAKIVLHKEDPSIAVLNVGEEEGKGRELERCTYELLKESGVNFVGYIEGHDITKGKADVIVTDGFSGNLVLKSSEGAANMLLDLLKSTYKNGNIKAKLGAFFLKSALKTNLARIDPNVNNGAMFVGINGIVVKSHGSATVLGMQSAIKVAFELAQCNINEQIIHELNVLEETGIGLNIVQKIKHTSAKILGLSK